MGTDFDSHELVCFRAFPSTPMYASVQ